MTVIFEYREINKKRLMYEFHFKSENNKNGGSHVCTLDKYMPLENWHDIYYRLNKYTDQYLLTPEVPFEETLRFRRAQLVLEIALKKLSRSIIKVNTGDGEVYPFYFHIDVRAASRVPDYIRTQKDDPESSSPTKVSETSKSMPAKTGKSDHSHNNNGHIEEYIPSVPCPSSNLNIKRNNRYNLTYTPSAKVNSDVTSKDNEEYTPRKVQVRANNNEDTENNVYKPSPVCRIRRTSHEQYIPETSPTDIIDLAQSQEESDLEYKPTVSRSRSRSRTKHELPVKSRSSPSSKHKRNAEGTKTSPLPSIKERGESGETPKPKRPKTESAIGSPLTSRANRSLDLFGEIDEEGKTIDKEQTEDKTDYESCTLKRDNFLRRAKMVDIDYTERQTNESSKTPKPDVKPPKITWLSKEKSKEFKEKSKESKEKSKESKEKSKESKEVKDNMSKGAKGERTDRKKTSADIGSKKTSGGKYTNEEIAKYKADHIKKMDEMKRIQAMQDEMLKPVKVDRVIDLKNLTEQDIISSFEDHYSQLNKIFYDYCGQNSRNVKHARDYQFYTILPTVLNEGIPEKMIDKLRKEFSKEHEPSGLEDSFAGCTYDTQFDNLFWELMVPEWSLMLLMEKFGLTRQEVTDQLDAQERASTSTTSLDFN